MNTDKAYAENNCQDDVDMIIDLIMRHTLVYGRSEP